MREAWISVLLVVALAATHAKVADQEFSGQRWDRRERFSVKHEMTRLAQRSKAARKAWRARKLMRAVREKQDAPPKQSKAERILDATDDDVSSAIVARWCDACPAYVRAVWRRAKLPTRSAGFRPLISLDT